MTRLRNFWTPRRDASASSPPMALSPEARVRAAGAWREQYNPLRGLTIDAAVAMLDRAQDGATADAQWTFAFLERRDEDLVAVIESTNAALLQLNWYVRTCEGDQRRKQDWDDILARDQAAVLLEHYNRIRNLYEALEHLAGAKFRGYAHVQVLAEGAWLRDLAPLPQWNVARDGFSGGWYWNPEARAVGGCSLPDAARLDPAAYLIVETPRPVDELALIKALRCSMSQKDWDAYIEVYGIPSWIVTMPAQVPPDQVAAYQTAAEKVAAGGSGALPNGSDAKAAAYPGGEAPFQAHIEHLTQRLVLAATGGLLSSLALPTGIGSGASQEHAETFARIARGRARMVSEEFQRKIDAPLLETAFPDRPQLAYFEFDAREETDVGEIVAHVASLAQAGLAVDPAQVAERTGYRVALAPRPDLSAAGAPLSFRADRTCVPALSASTSASTCVPALSAGTAAAAAEALSFRADAAAAAAASGNAGADPYAAAVAEGLREDLREVAEALAELAAIEDPARRAAAAAQLLSRWPEITRAAAAGDAAPAALEAALAAAFADTASKAPNLPSKAPISSTRPDTRADPQVSFARERARFATVPGATSP